MAAQDSNWLLAAGTFALRLVRRLCAGATLDRPPTTAVQMERRVSALWKHNPYKKRYDFVPMGRISPNLQHAVVAAEDGRFRKHHGFDWVEMEKVLEQDIQRHKLGRGGSTITQQLVKNLF